MVKYSFEAVMGALGLQLDRSHLANEVKAKELAMLRRFVWRNYRALLTIDKKGWFALSRKQKARGGNGERLIFSRDKALGQSLWFAADFAKRNGFGLYAKPKALATV